jgi:Protein of unknown function (DUF732)
MDGKHCRTALSNNWVTEKYDRMVSTQANVTPVKKTTLALAIATAAPALIFAAPAHADQSVEDIAFLATLLERPNIHFASDDQAILGGKAVCAMMKQGDSLSSAALGVQTTYGLNRSDSNYFVGAATNSYCKPYSPLS